MRLRDPSEAVESDVIVPALRERFDVAEHRPLGGTLINLVLAEIAHHFSDSGDRYLRMLFVVEDTLISSGRLTSDHALLVCQVQQKPPLADLVKPSPGAAPNGPDLHRIG